jgi:hypothetical protein
MVYQNGPLKARIERGIIQTQGAIMKSIDLLEALQHGVPEMLHIDPLANGRIGCPMHEVAVGPASALPLDFYLYKGPSGLEVLGTQQVVDGAWVVRHGEVEILPLLVLSLEVAHQGD